MGGYRPSWDANSPGKRVVGGTTDYLAQKYHLVGSLNDGGVVVHHARQAALQFSKFMVMGGKEAPGTD